jgi:RimJ/RimL family protein N-acetyltransferase
MILLAASNTDILALIAGDSPRDLELPDGAVESAEVLGMLRDLANTIRPTFEPASWMAVEGHEIVGLCSLVKPPHDSGIDIGYGIAATRRQQGHASAAVGALLDWARTDDRVQSVRAETSVDNLASQRVLEVNGFTRSGRRIDEEDGELICWSIATAT